VGERNQLDILVVLGSLAGPQKTEGPSRVRCSRG
jgi:hypothetical protein